MPWYGWLMTFGIISICATLIIVARIMAGTMRAAMQDVANNDRPMSRGVRVNRDVGRRGGLE